MASNRRFIRAAAAVALGLATLLASACSSKPSAAPSTMLGKTAPAKLSLDAELSPVTFRWLADDAVLVPTKVGDRKLAAFGNYVGRAAGKLERARVSVWDDEAAWKVASGKGPAGDATLAHKRAEFVKEAAGPEPVERFMVFDASGQIVYQRDFRAYPISDLD